MALTSPTTQDCCFGCNSVRIITDHESGELICGDCGLVISNSVESQRDLIIDLPINTLDSNTCNGLPTSLALYDKGLPTVIGVPYKDAKGQSLDASMRSRMERLRRWDLRIKTDYSHDVNLKDPFRQLDALKDKLGVSDIVVEKAASIYRKVQNKGLIKGRTIPAVLDASLYAACRQLGIPKTLKEIAGANNVKRRSLAKYYRMLITELDIKIPVVEPIDCIVKVSNKANLNEKTKHRAINIIHQVDRNKAIVGKDPMGIAAAVLYIACLNVDEKRTQSEIAQAAGITEMTLRNIYKVIKKHYKSAIDPQCKCQTTNKQLKNISHDMDCEVHNQRQEPIRSS